MIKNKKIVNIVMNLKSRKEHILWNLEKASKKFYLQESAQQQ